MRLDNGPADRQSHAGALRLGGKECIKNLVRLLSRQPHARIADGDQQLTILGLAVLNETHFSYNRAKLHAALAQFKIDATRLGFTFPVTAPFANIPLVAIAGLTSIGTSNFFNTDKTNNIFLFEDNLSISHGRHLIRAGVHIGSTQVHLLQFQL